MSKKSISRTEKTEDGYKVVSNDRFDGLGNELVRLDEELNVYIGSGFVRVFFGGKASEDQSKWEFTSENLIYYETDLITRPLTDAEVAWCDDTFMYAGDSQPDELYCFEIPKPEKLKSSILSENLDSFDNLNANISVSEERQSIASSMQEKIARSSYRSNQLSLFGELHDIDPEWNPEHSDKSRDHLEDMARMRRDSYVDVWKDTFGIPYYQLKESRFIAQDMSEPWLRGAVHPSYKMVELGVIGKDDSKSYCRLSGSVMDKSDLLNVEVRGYSDRTIRVSEESARRYIGNKFENEAVAKAIDKRALRNGEGQRRLHSEFGRLDI